jgi:hypothetical protein
MLATTVLLSLRRVHARTALYRRNTLSRFIGPIKVAPRQLRVLHYLLQHRIDADTCESYTAAKLVEPNGEKVKANRPIQTTTNLHNLVYCKISTLGFQKRKGQGGLRKVSVGEEGCVAIIISGVEG